MSKAMLRPSGVQSALMASPLTWVIWRRSRPFGRTVKIWTWWSVARENAIRPLRPGKVACAGEAGTSARHPPIAMASAVRRQRMVLHGRRPDPGRSLARHRVQRGSYGVAGGHGLPLGLVLGGRG